MKFPKFILLVFAVALLILFMSPSSKPKETALSDMSFDQLKEYFMSLANQKGAGVAYEALKSASLPANTDLHLLGHVVGDVLYKQQGAEGIQICTPDFRNACSHSIVVGLFSDKGEEALNEVKEACQKAPGGVGAYLMCYHGLGHGILAFEGYDFPKTIKLCQKTATQEHQNSEYPECVSGAVMEIISGGGHDTKVWGKKRPEYLKVDNPFYLCSSFFMPEEVRSRCYDYLTPYLWEAVGGDLNNPTEIDFGKSFKLCNKITEEKYRNICFAGFGKEFVGLAQSRDIRRVDQMGDDRLRQVVKWCNLAEDNTGVAQCLTHALRSIFWGGENDYHASIRFCNVIPDADRGKSCFLNLINQVSYYIKDAKIKASFCKEIPSLIYSECQKELSI